MNPSVISALHTESASLLLSGLHTETGSLLLLGLALYVAASFTRRWTAPHPVTRGAATAGAVPAMSQAGVAAVA